MKKPRQKLFRAALFAVAFLLLGFGAYAQKSAISGAVTSAEDGEPLPGVSILIKGTSVGTISDENGQFSLEAGEGDVLIFSYVGFVTEEISVVGGQSVYNMALSPDLIRMSELVVIGYGAVQKSSVTGSVSQVSSEAITEMAVPTIESALQGRATGVSVTNNGAPGEEPIVRIRGNSSISRAANPLYVVDGVPTDQIGNFSPNDIESVEVLKDASATAIYGSRASAGVILITTKKGSKDGKLNISLDAKFGTQKLPKKLDLLNTEQYLVYMDWMLNPTDDRRDLDQPINSQTSQTFRQTDTDWQDELFQTGKIEEYNISGSFGSDKSQYFTSVGFLKNKGIMVNTGYERFNVRFNSDHKLTNFLSIGQTMMYSESFRLNENQTQGRQNVMHMIRSVPYMPVLDPDKVGGYLAPSGIDNTDPDNPVKIQELFWSNSGTKKLFGSMYAELSITKDLKFRSVFGLDQTDITHLSGVPIYNDGFNSASTGTSTKVTNSITQRLFTNQLTFDKKFADHALNVIAVAEQQQFVNHFSSISGNNLSNAISGISELINIVARGTTEENLLLSYLGRINYSYKDKYLLSAAVRSDGSSKLSEGNKWGIFPSASVGWRISEEPFLQGNATISNLKLRGGYGVVGNNNIGNYDWQSRVVSNAPYTINNSVVDGVHFNNILNPDLKWEKTESINIGVDAGLFDDKVTATIEYFKNETDELILAVPLPNSLGISSQYFDNVGSMRNSGVEVELGFTINSGDLKSQISANASMIKNKVLSLSTPDARIFAGSHSDFGGFDITMTAPNEPIQCFYGWEVEGIFQTQDEIDALNRYVNEDTTIYYQSEATSPGDIKFVDQNGDGVVNSADRKNLGSHMPKIAYGFNYTGTYKNFDFTLFVQGVAGNKIYNGTKVLREGMIRLFGAGTEVLNAWTPSNTNTDVPRAIANDPNGNTRTSDRFLEDGSYLRLKSLTIGYTIPEKTIGSLIKGISSVRLHVSAQNLLTLSQYSGYDPEVGATVPLVNGVPDPSVSGFLLREGIDYGFVPTPKTIVVGVNVNF